MLYRSVLDWKVCSFKYLTSLFLPGLEAIAVDYVQPVRVGGSTLIPKLAVGAVWALSAFTLGALYYFNYTDVGIVHAIKMLWSL